MTVWVFPWQRNLVADCALDISCTLSQREKEVKDAYPTKEFGRKIDEKSQFCANHLVKEIFLPVDNHIRLRNERADVRNDLTALCTRGQKPYSV
jgi:hypothetical protein